VADAGGARESTFNLNLAGPANEAPTVTRIRPPDGAKISDRTPTIAATARDSATDLAKANLRLRLDGRVKTGISYDRGTDRLSFTTNRLQQGIHRVKLRVTDAQGLATARSWSFRIT